MRGWAVVAIAGVLLGVSGCGAGQRTPPPYRVGHAAASGRSIRLPQVSGIADGGLWPNACTMLTDGELRAVLPQVTHIERLPNDKKVTIDYFHGQELAGAGETLAKNADCQYQLTFTFDYDDGEPGDVQYFGTVFVSDEAVGGRDAVGSNWKRDLGPGAGKERLKIAGLPCFGRSGESVLNCKSKSLYYSVNVQLDTQYTRGSDGGFVRIESAGKVRRFPRVGSGGTAPEYEAERKQIVTKLAHTINVKLH